MFHKFGKLRTEAEVSAVLSSPGALQIPDSRAFIIMSCLGAGICHRTYVLQENAELRVGLWVDGGLEHREEDVLQHFAKVGHEVPASEDVANVKTRKIGFVNPTLHSVRS